MYRNIHVKLQNLLLSLSDALDLANPVISQHQIRTAFIAWKMSRTMGLSSAFENDLFVASLLHDVGALSPEDKLTLHKSEVEDTQLHCILGERLLQTIPIFQISAQMVRDHHTPWITYEVDEPKGVVLGAQIIKLADTVERAIFREKFILYQNEDIISLLKMLSGTEITPCLLDAFQSFAHREDFWLDLVSERLYSILLNYGPCRNIEIDLSSLLTISEMFRDMIDFRSQFTATHSSGVAAAASKLARLFGYTDKEVELMEVAGNLHDLGKLAIPNRILNKPDKLTKEEYAFMRQHTYHTYTILSTIGGIQRIAEWAAFHHERLDGSGYPFHLSAKDLSINARIMAVADIFTALSEERPYRRALDQADVLLSLKSLCNRNWLDASIVDLLAQNYDEVVATTREQQVKIKAYYETNFSVFPSSNQTILAGELK